MGILSKLFGSKPQPEAASATPVHPPLGLDVADARGSTEKCLAALAALAEASEDPRDRAVLLARIAEARLHGGDREATLRAMIAAFNTGLQLGLVNWTVELCRGFVHDFEAGPKRAVLRPIVDALARVLEVVNEDDAQELRAEIGALQAAVGDYSGAAATVTLIEDAYFADQARARVIERMCENGETKAAEVLANELQDPDARGAAKKAIVHQRSKAKVDAALEAYAAGIREQPWRDDVRLDLAVAKARDGALDAALTLANAIGKPETRATALSQIAEHLVEQRSTQRVEELLSSIGDPHSRSAAWATVAAAHTRLGDVPAAEAALARISDPWSALEVATQLARCEALQDDAERSAHFLRAALELLKRAQTPNELGAARRKTAELLANAGNSSEALRVAALAPKDERDGILVSVGTGLALHGALEEIDRLQASWKSADDRAALLVGAAGVLARRAAPRAHPH